MADTRRGSVVHGLADARGGEGESSTGWLTHWGEPMANTSLDVFIKGLNGIMDYDGGWGSFNLYMAHGGTNFGYGAGAVPVPPYLNKLTNF